MTNPCRFYVYEHWRPDHDVCFWVGKGTGDRAYRFKRNREYDQIIAFLASLGMCAEVRLVQCALTEMEALLIERQRIAFWRAAAVGLANRTHGGDGNRGLMVSDETRQKLRAANLGRRHSPETRAKMSASRVGKGKGRPAGFEHSRATRTKMSAAQMGHIQSIETREKLRIANLGRKQSIETREKMSRQRLGNKSGAGGRGLKRSPETIARMRNAQRGHSVSLETRMKIRATLKARAMAMQGES